MPSLALSESKAPRMYSTKSDSVGSGLGGGAAFLCTLFCAVQRGTRKEDSCS